MFFSPDRLDELLLQADRFSGAVFLIGGASIGKSRALKSYALSRPSEVAYVDLVGAAFTHEMRVSFQKKSTRHALGVYPVRIDAAETVIIDCPELCISLAQVAFGQCAIDQVFKNRFRRVLLPVRHIRNVQAFGLPKAHVSCVTVTGEVMTAP